MDWASPYGEADLTQIWARRPKLFRRGIDHHIRINQFFHLYVLGGRVKPPRAGGTASFKGPPRPRVAIEGKATCFLPSSSTPPTLKLEAGSRHARSHPPEKRRMGR